MAAASLSQGMASRLVQIKNVLVNALGELTSIWEDIGLLEDQKEKRLDLAFMYIGNLIEEMVTEEEKRRNTLKENIEIYRNKLSTLCAELDLAPIQPTASRLYKIEAELKQNVSCFEKEKDDRLQELKQLAKIEQALCDSMYMTPTYFSRDAVPTTTFLQQLRKRIDELAVEKAKRYEQFLEARRRIADILTDIGQEVMTEFEQDVVIEEPESFVLSEANMTQLKATNEKLEVQQAERVKFKQTLMEKISSLWTRLEISKAEQEKVREGAVDHTPASLQILKKELERCEILKKEHLREFTEKLRVELEQWWEKCYYSKQQRAAFTAFKSDEYTEDLLIQHEDALEAVKFFYAENEHLLQKIEKRRVLWNQMVEFDVKENDVNRFRNRGGNLLAEEKAKKKVLHQLPKVEEQLKQEIEQWEQENDREFLIGGVQFFEFCRHEWEEYKQSKELQKQQRLEQKEKEMQSEIRFGSKPTPAKRRFCVGGPAAGTPKQRKLNDTTRSATRLASLSRIHSVFTSPVTPARKCTPMRQSKTTSSLCNVTPVSARKPPIPRTPASSMAPPRTPKSTMGPPCTPMSTRSAIRQHEMKKAKSCLSLASPTLKKPGKGKATAKTATKGKKIAEQKVDQENTTPPFSSSADVISLSSQSSEVEPLVSSYEEFENVLHSAAKNKQCRSTMFPKT